MSTINTGDQQTPEQGLMIDGLYGLAVSPAGYAIAKTGADTFANINVLFSGGSGLFANGLVTAPSIAFTTDPTTGFYHTGTGATGAIYAGVNGVNKLALTATGLGIGTLAPTHALTFPSGSTGIALYNTADQVTNYERFFIGFSGNVLTLRSQKGGTGTNRDLVLGTVSRTFNIYELPTAGQGFYSFINSTGGSWNAVAITTTRANSSANSMELMVNPSWAGQTGSAGGTCILVNPVVAGSSGTGPQLLQDWQVGGVSQVSFSARQTIASATSAVWDKYKYSAVTLNLTGATAITTAAGFNMMTLNAPTIVSDTATCAITSAATLYISGPPIASTNVTIANPAALVVDSGNVGIGTTTPNYKIHVVGTGLVTGNFAIGTPAVSRLFTVTSSSATSLVAFGTSNGEEAYFGVGSSVIASGAINELGFAADIISLAAKTGARRLTIDNSNNVSIPLGTLTVSGSGDSSFVGNVGIGTTSTQGKLDIRQAADGTVLLYGQRYTDSGGGTGSLIRFKDATGSSDVYRVDTSGNTIQGKLTLQQSGGGDSGQTYLLDAGDETTVLNNQQYRFRQYATTGGTFTSFGIELKRDNANYAGYNALSVNAIEDITGAAGSYLLNLQRNSISQFVVQSNGNVGIGTTTPTAKLHIAAGAMNLPLKVESTSAGSYSASLFINQASNATANTARIVLSPSSAFDTVPNVAPYIEAGNAAGTNETFLAFGTYNGSALHEAMRIDKNGSVSIGAAAGRKLNVYYDPGAAIAAGLNFGHSGSGGALLGILATATGHGWGGNKIIFYDDISSHPLQTLDFNTGNIWLGGITAATAPVMAIQGDGNVGIGTTTPTAKLHIAAGVAAANGAPLKLTPGVLLTTPELGAIEMTDDGTTAHIYATVRIATVVTRVQIV